MHHEKKGGGLLSIGCNMGALVIFGVIHNGQVHEITSSLVT